MQPGNSLAKGWIERLAPIAAATHEANAARGDAQAIAHWCESKLSKIESNYTLSDGDTHLFRAIALLQKAFTLENIERMRFLTQALDEVDQATFASLTVPGADLLQARLAHTLKGQRFE